MYIWTEYPNIAIWNHDKFETVQECINDAKKNYSMKQGETIYIGECQLMDYIKDGKLPKFYKVINKQKVVID